MKKYILLMLFLLPSRLLGGGYPGEFLNIGVGARAIGLGKTSISLCDDIATIYWNPAGLANLKKAGIAYDSVRLFSDVTFTNIYTNIPSGERTGLGIIWSRVAVKDIEKTDNNASLGSFNTYQDAYYFSAGRKFSSDLDIGATLKLMNQNLGDYKDNGFSLDFGMLFHDKNSNMSFVIKDMAGTMGGETIPATFSFGVAWMKDWRIETVSEVYEQSLDEQFIHNKGDEISPSYERPQVKQNIDMDEVETKEVIHVFNIDINVGASFAYSPGRSNELGISESIEFWLNKTLGVRCGLEQKNGSGDFSYMNGLGLGGSVKIKSIVFDYTYKYFERLENRHYISLSYLFL